MMRIAIMVLHEPRNEASVPVQTSSITSFPGFTCALVLRRFWSVWHHEAKPQVIISRTTLHTVKDVSVYMG